MRHACLTNETLFIDTKVNDLMTMTLTFIQKISILDLVAAGDIHVSQTHLVVLEERDSRNLVEGEVVLN